MRAQKVEQALNNIISIDPMLENYRSELAFRLNHYSDTKDSLLDSDESLLDFATAHKYYGFHRTEKGFVYREWAPNARALYLVGDFNDWQPHTHPMHRIENGSWEIFVEDGSMKHGQKVKVLVNFDHEDHYKIPLYAKNVVQEFDESGNVNFSATVWVPEEEFKWTDDSFLTKKMNAPIIYEAHIGMALEEGKIGSYREFADYILPRIKEGGYNTLQLMAIMQHPYYGSFGYHVANFFAASSWFGTPDDLKYLINKAHEMGIQVLMDLVHSHAVKNTIEGINQFDGTQTQFFYEGERGKHNAWDSMCFNYGKKEVLRFLLSNLKFWLEEYHFDGFRFDGVTSMLYWDHAMGVAFDSYDKYFTSNTNIEATSYLALASELVHSYRKNTVLVAEDMSGMPGLCLPIKDGGLGFDYRLSMGIPDMWIKQMQIDDHDWNINDIYWELTTKRPHEKRINYVESHDQSIVGDKTIFFWLADQEAYWHMHKDDNFYVIDRAMALHKMIRLITISTGSEGYLSFIGNEFGHPEWVDFPRAENGWSFHYSRRQWSLADNPDLKYQYLQLFDKDMVHLMTDNYLMGAENLQHLFADNQRKIIGYRNNNYIFIFNFHPTDSYEKLFVPVHDKGIYRVVFSTDRSEYGGYDRISENYGYTAKTFENTDYGEGIILYMPARTALVLKKQTSNDANNPNEEEKSAIDQLFEAELKAQEALNERLREN